MDRPITGIVALIIVAAIGMACTAVPATTSTAPTAVLVEPSDPAVTATLPATPTVPPSSGAPMSPSPTAVPTRASTSIATVAQPEETPIAATVAPPPATALKGQASMKVRLKVEDKTLTATLNDGKAAQDFASLLPLTLTLQDYNGTEKISDLPKRLSTEGAPAGSDPAVGDIAYYAPWGNLALYYRDFGYSSGLVILGRIDGGIGAFDVPGSVKVTIELLLP